MAAVSQKWKDSVGKEIIEMGAYVFVWAIGVYCCIRLMRDYEFILKPLFLAAVFVSVLESGVEMCEAILVRSARRLWMLLLVIVIQPVRDLFSKVCGYYVDRSAYVRCAEVLRCQEKKGLIVLPSCKDRIKGWFDSACWLLALVITLLIITVLVWLAWVYAGNEFQEFHNRGRTQAYIKAGKSLTTSLVLEVQDLPTHIPIQSVNNTETVEWWRSTVHNYTADITEHGAEFAGYLEGAITSTFSGGWEYTVNFVTQFVFFLLYSLFWLFDPLAIMLGPSRQPRKPGLELLELLKPAEAASGDASGPASRPADAAAEGASRPSPAQAGDAEVGCCPSWLAGGSSPLREPFLGSSCPGGEEAEEEDHEIGVGSTVKVRRGHELRAFRDEEGTPEEKLEEGRGGVVEKIDEDGHALVAFDPKRGGPWHKKLLTSETAVKHWVPRHELQNKLRAVTPRPNAADTVKIIQKYFKLKTYINFFIGVAYWLLFRRLHVDLRFVLVLMAFFLGFIPELGFIAQFVVSLPVVVFSPVDSNGVLDGSTALWNLKCFIMGSFAIKLVINNVIETIVMKSDKVLNQGGQEVHAVLILFLLALGGEVWGCVGMLLAVPGISLGRLVMRLADDTIRRRRHLE